MDSELKSFWARISCGAFEANEENVCFVSDDFMFSVDAINSPLHHWMMYSQIQQGSYFSTVERTKLRLMDFLI